MRSGLIYAESVDSVAALDRRVYLNAVGDLLSSLRPFDRHEVYTCVGLTTGSKPMVRKGKPSAEHEREWAEDLVELAGGPPDGPADSFHGPRSPEMQAYRKRMEAR